MLYLPDVFGKDLMDDFFGDTFGLFDKEMCNLDNEFSKKNPLYGKHAKHMMKTDVRELENAYEADIELPGFKKEDINVSLENGYLTITAAKGLDKEEKDEKKGRVIRSERYVGSLSRSFYVGEEIKEDDIKAKLEHGVLMLTIPKKEVKPEVPAKKTIMIEG